MNHKDVYIGFNVELVQQLKLKDPLFIAILTTQCLFFGELKAKVRKESTEAEASTLFLQEAIEPSLETNDPEPFMKLLSAMDQFGGPLKKLSAEMKKHLKSPTTESQSTDILGKYAHVSVYMCTYSVWFMSNPTALVYRNLMFLNQARQLQFGTHLVS